MYNYYVNKAVTKKRKETEKEGNGYTASEHDRQALNSDGLISTSRWLLRCLFDSFA
jgi:hypothetical protein